MGSRLAHIPSDAKVVIDSFLVMSFFGDLPDAMLTFMDVHVYLFYYVTYDILLRTVPFSTRISHHQYPRWFDQNLIHLLKQKNKQYSMYRDTRSAEGYREYSALRRRFKAEHATAHSAYILTLESGMKSDPKKFWNYVDSKRKVDGLDIQIEWRSDPILLIHTKKLAIYLLNSSVACMSLLNIRHQSHFPWETPIFWRAWS